ncbi:hypothetical protein [Sphingorhabdus sp. EL138]|uniref:hypothetical protein n=1 Tax=Sphingorhabdus sp. EL138 TaxID=2073156 RepID=UPI0025DAA8F4|nr:hypothetical protein [Sphingorhabdus sp. EL138]
MFDYASVRKMKVGKVFQICVIIPTLLSCIYFGFIASGVYISESRFVVQSPERSSVSGIGQILAGGGFTNAGEEVSAAKVFVESRDALVAVNLNGAFEKAFSRAHISIFDRFNPLGIDGTFEDLFAYYGNHVRIDNDVTTSISTLTVRAYSAKDAQRFNRQLLELSELTINRMNQRGRDDMIRFAQLEVEEAKNRSRKASLALAAFRNKTGFVDPELQASAQLEMVSKLQDEIIATQTQLNQLEAFTPRNPQIPTFENRLKSLQSAARKELGTLAGGNKSLASSAVEYQRLFLENSFAEKQLGSALVSLQEARNEARRQQVYVERIAQPNLPDAPLEPRRLRGILSTLALGLVAWGVLSMLLAGVKEHGQ